MRVAETLAVLAASFLGFSEAATAIWHLEENPEYPGKCVVPDSFPAAVLSPGERYDGLEGCTRAVCQIRGGLSGGLALTLSSCGSIGQIPAGCRLETSPEEAYPECCPTLVCDDHDEEEEEQYSGEPEVWSGSNAAPAQAPDYGVYYDVELEEETTTTTTTNTTTTTPKPTKKSSRKKATFFKKKPFGPKAARRREGRGRQQNEVDYYSRRTPSYFDSYGRREVMSKMANRRRHSYRYNPWFYYYHQP